LMNDPLKQKVDNNTFHSNWGYILSEPLKIVKHDYFLRFI
jgi:hypothetical protein